MATVTLVNGEKNDAADTIQTFYTSPVGKGGTLITAFTATNDSDVNRSYKGYIFDVTGTVIDAVSPLKVVVRNRFDAGPALVNQLIPQGGTLRMESDLSDSIIYRVTGKEL